MLGAGILLFALIYLPTFWFFSMNQYERDLLLKPMQKVLIKLKIK
jgi:Ni,Fe-hydrogenase I cytochrome b subunit